MSAPEATEALPEQFWDDIRASRRRWRMRRKIIRTTVDLLWFALATFCVVRGSGYLTPELFVIGIGLYGLLTARLLLRRRG